MELNCLQFLRLPLLWKFLNEAAVDLVLLATLRAVRVYQATNRLLLAALEEYEGSVTTQKEDVKKTRAKSWNQL